jgi:peptidoglycan/xylan/chitin deacetylase (PgdA/CDA1 family)
MLDIQRRPDIDAGLDQFLDILEAFGMPATFGGIGVGEFVDDA